MDKYEETFATWNKVARLYQDTFMHLNLYDDTYAAYCNLLSANATVLEIGCGPGNITKYLHTKRPDLKIKAIDIAPQMIALAKTNVPTATFMVMDTRDIHQLQQQFNGIICGFCLPYLSESDRVKLIADCKQLLTPDGVLYLSFVEGESSQSGYQAGSSGDRTYFYYHNLDALTNELRQHDFNMIQLFHKPYVKNVGTEEIHTIIIARKV